MTKFAQRGRRLSEQCKSVPRRLNSTYYVNGHGRFMTKNISGEIHISNVDENPRSEPYSTE